MEGLVILLVASGGLAGLEPIGYAVATLRIAGELQAFATEQRLTITVCRFPPGTSKWNKIGHRLFSFITMNWRSQPLTDYWTIVNLIAGTKTRQSLTVKARLDRRVCKRGIQVSAQEIRLSNSSPIPSTADGIIP
jgi:hypothetical protein